MCSTRAACTSSALREQEELRGPEQEELRGPEQEELRGELREYFDHRVKPA
jgi:hypothetical protein